MIYRIFILLGFTLIGFSSIIAQSILNPAANNTGIGTNVPLEKLHVHGNILQTHLQLTPLQLPGRPTRQLETSEVKFQMSALSSTDNAQSVNRPLNFSNTFHGTVSFSVFANHELNLRKFAIKTEQANMPISFFSQENENFRIKHNGIIGVGQSLGVGTFEPDGAIHILQPGAPPSGLPGTKNGLLLGTAGTGSYKWIQSYGGSLALNPMGNRVGIGLSNPSTTLHVSGDTKVDGTLQVTDRVKASIVEITGGSDLAEPFPISGAIQPGMVVIIDQGREGGLKPSDKAYDKKVVGVVSGANNLKPGITLKQTGSMADGEHLIALAGRVYCFVDANYGTIEAGDFLTSSPKAGFAMKVTDYEKAQGAIIGKALTSLNEGTGKILMLISLQ